MAAATVWTYFRRFFNQDGSGESRPGPDLHEEGEEGPLESNLLQDEILNGVLGKSFASGHSKATKEKKLLVVRAEVRTLNSGIVLIGHWPSSLEIGYLVGQQLPTG